MYTNESEYTPTDVNRLGRECSTEQEAVQQLQILEYLARETVEITLRKNPKAAFEHLKIPFPNEEFAVVLDQSLASYGAWRHLTKRLRGNSLTDLVALHLGLDPIRGFFRIADWLNIDTSPEARFFQGCDPGWHECRSGVEAKDFEKATKSYPYYTLNNAIGLRYPYTNEDGTLRWGVVKLFDKKGTTFKLPLVKCYRSDRCNVRRYGWKWRVVQSPFPLFNLHDLIAREGHAVLCALDEETASQISLEHRWLVKSGVVPTTWPGGRKGIACTDWSALKGREVLLLPSYAADGYRQIYEASRAIQKAGAGQVRILSRAPQWEFRGETERLAHDLAVWTDPARRLSARAFCEEAERLFGLNLDGQVETAFQSKSLETLLAMPEEPRPYVLKPVMLSPGLMMLVAGTGVGKTWVALAVALAVWKGTSALGGKWTASRTRNVLYLDGEMGESACKERLEDLCQAQGHTVDEEIGGKRFELFSTMTEGNALPDLGTEEGGKVLLSWIDKRFPGVEFIVFDNLSTLAPTACGNSTECQEEFRVLLKKLKARGISCLIVQHTSKTGDQRGSNAKLDILDAVVKLDRPSKKGSAEKTTTITVTYEKCRNAFGSDIEPFTVELSPPDGLLATSACEGQTKKSAPDVGGLQPAWLEDAKRMKQAGMGFREIAQELVKLHGSAPSHETIRKRLK